MRLFLVCHDFVLCLAEGTVFDIRMMLSYKRKKETRFRASAREYTVGFINLSYG
jgi:hypothetical protein